MHVRVHHVHQSMAASMAPPSSAPTTLPSAVAPLARYCRGAFINGPMRMCAALLYWCLIGFVIALCFVPGVTKLELLAALVAMKVARAATTLNPAPTLTLALAHGSSRCLAHPLTPPCRSRGLSTSPPPAAAWAARAQAPRPLNGSARPRARPVRLRSSTWCPGTKAGRCDLRDNVSVRVHCHRWL